MATAIFVQNGDCIDYTPVTDTPAGTFVVQGDLVGITTRDLAANEKGSLALTGVFEVPVETVSGWSVGMKGYWSPGDHWIESHDDAGTLKYAGKAVHVPATGTRILFRLDQ